MFQPATGIDCIDSRSPAGLNFAMCAAHAKESDVRASLELLGISRDCEEYQDICFTAIGMVANCIAQLVDVIEPQAPICKSKP